MNKQEILEYHKWLDEQYRIAEEQALRFKEEETKAQRLSRVIDEGLCIKCESSNVVGEGYRAISGMVGKTEHTLELETRVCLDCGHTFEVGL